MLRTETLLNKRSCLRNGQCAGFWTVYCKRTLGKIFPNFTKALPMEYPGSSPTTGHIPHPPSFTLFCHLSSDLLKD